MQNSLFYNVLASPIQDQLDDLKQNPHLIFLNTTSFPLHQAFYLEQRDNPEHKPVTDFVYTLSTPPSWHNDLHPEDFLYDETKLHNKLLLAVCSEKINALLESRHDASAQAIAFRYKKVRDHFLFKHKESSFYQALQDKLWSVPFIILHYCRQMGKGQNQCYNLLTKAQSSTYPFDDCAPRRKKTPRIVSENKNILEILGQEEMLHEQYLAALLEQIKAALGQEYYFKFINKMSCFYRSLIVSKSNHRFLAYLVMKDRRVLAQALIKSCSPEMLVALLNARGDKDEKKYSVFTLAASCDISGSSWFIEYVFNQCHQKEFFLNICYPENSMSFLEIAVCNNRENHSKLFLQKALELEVTAEELQTRVTWLDTCYLLRELFIAFYKNRDIESLLKILKVYKRKEYYNSSDDSSEDVEELMESLTITPHFKKPEPFNEQLFLATYYDKSLVSDSSSERSLLSDESGSSEEQTSSDHEQPENSNLSII